MNGKSLLNCEHTNGAAACSDESGFTLIETTISLVVILIALLGVAQTFTYAITYNLGNATRTQSLVILQQEVEGMRAANWTAAGIDSNLTGGVKADRAVTSPNGGQFRISVTVDDDPYTDGVDIDANTQIKEITITVRLVSPSAGWQFALPTTVVMRRSRGN
jgi:prepilin-type N-terminal cleavage/methylation domain-containing protein